MKYSRSLLATGVATTGGLLMATNATAADSQPKKKMNVLFIISDDLTGTALSSYENKTCKTPNIDKLASEGMRYTRTFCQFPVSGPSRASFMNGYYPHATRAFGYASGRRQIGNQRETWSQYFKNNGYYTARVSKIYHMGVPGDIERGSNGTDDPASWTERFNSKGPEWKAEGEAHLCQNNPTGKIERRGGNVMTVVKADGDDLVHADGKTAVKACELIRKHKNKPFFLGVGFVRPHVPFVAPAKYFKNYPHEKTQLPESVENDWNDIPKAGINYRTSPGMKMTEEQKKRAIAGYYASVSYMDAQVGKVLNALKEEGLEDNTIVIFTSDHGFHLGEHDFWMKVGLMDESSRVPMIIKVPGKKPGVCHSFTELIDLFPTTAELCGLKVPERLQGKSLVKTLDDPTIEVRDAAFCVNGNSLLIRTDKWAYIQHGEDASQGIQLYDMVKDPKQFTNLATNPEYKSIVEKYKQKLVNKLKEVRTNDLGIDYKKTRGKKKKTKPAKKH